MAITMKDIAKDLGVPVVTLSKVLRNHSEVGAETWRRVRQRMEELNYRPNPADRALYTALVTSRLHRDEAIASAQSLITTTVLRVPLISIDQDSYRLGATAAKLAPSIISNKSLAYGTTLRAAGPRSSS
jgi:DNA-binding LacI/PurR family transcriptional regulator